MRQYFPEIQAPQKLAVTEIHKPRFAKPVFGLAKLLFGHSGNISPIDFIYLSFFPIHRRLSRRFRVSIPFGH